MIRMRLWDPRVRSAGLAARVCAGALVALFLAACAADRPAAADTQRLDWIVDLTASEGVNNFFAQFVLQRDGTLQYTAGLNSRLVWQGKLTDQQREQIIGWVRTNPNPARTEPPGYSEPGRRYRLMVAAPGELVSRTLESGRTPFLDDLYGMFQSIQWSYRKDAIEPMAIPPVK